jgi:hypothetical protein
MIEKECEPPKLIEIDAKPQSSSDRLSSKVKCYLVDNAQILLGQIQYFYAIYGLSG